MFYPFEVIVYLKAPLLYHTRRPLYPVCLDSLLTWAAAVEQRGLKAMTPAPESLVEIPLPLAQSGTDKKYYHASAMMLPDTGSICIDRFSWVRSQSWLDYGAKYIKKARKRLVVQKSRGQMRAYSDEYITVTTPYVKFYGCGNPHEIARLMNYITHISPRRAVGGGAVHSVKIRPAEDDYGVIKDGYPTRPIPAKEIEGSPLWFRSEATYKPPYWDVRYATHCYMPLPEQWCPSAVLPSKMISDPQKRKQRIKNT